MSYYSLTLCFILSLFGNETRQLVEFKETEVVKVIEDDHMTVTLPFEVLETYHIQSNANSSGGQIATEVTFKENRNYTIERQEFSLKQHETIVLDGVKNTVISSRFEITVALKRIENASDVTLEGELYYQACTDRQCLFPRALSFHIPL